MHCSVGFLEHMESWVFPSVKATSDIKAHVSPNQHTPLCPPSSPSPVRCCSQMAIVFIPHIFNQWNVFWLLSPACSPRNVLARHGSTVQTHDLSDCAVRQQGVGNAGTALCTQAQTHRKTMHFQTNKPVEYLLFPPQRVFQLKSNGEFAHNHLVCTQTTVSSPGKLKPQKTKI